MLKKALPFYIIFMLMCGIVCGCQRQRIEGEVVPVYSSDAYEHPSLFVHHVTKGSQVLVECVVKGISFRESDHSKRKIGKVMVWIDGKRNREVSSAAFIINGLTPGSHKVKLEVVKLNHDSYGLRKEFVVNIPK